MNYAGVAAEARRSNCSTCVRTSPAQIVLQLLSQMTARAGLCTMDKVWLYVAWSFTVLQQGEWPSRGPCGEDFSRRGRSDPGFSCPAFDLHPATGGWQRAAFTGCCMALVLAALMLMMHHPTAHN